ncbi:MAG: arginine repressor [Bacteroidaceae bacterium]|nr:arginine repressor [Bacteroidaceae bacterium]
MTAKKTRLEIIKLVISSQEISNQEELRNALLEEGIDTTQATLSRDLKRLKVAKVSSATGKAVYILPNNTMYKRVREHQPISEMKTQNGIISVRFSGNLGVVKTRPGYAGSVGYDIDNADITEIIGTVAGDDTIIMVLDENTSRDMVMMKLKSLLGL